MTTIVSMACISKVSDVHVALQKAKKKMCGLQVQLQHLKSIPDNSEDNNSSRWTPSKDLQDSLVDMYKDNPQVNEELRQRLPSPACQQRILAHRGAAGPVSSADVGDMEADLSPSRPSPHSPPLPGHVSSRRQDSAIGGAAAYEQAPPPAGDKKVSLLLRELDALRDANKKLLEQLSLKEEELQRKEVELQRKEVELRAEQNEAKAWERPSELLDQLLCAHKDRDQALRSRVMLANQERDEALHRVAQLQQAARCDFDTINVEDCDLEVEGLLQRVCDSASMQEITHFGSALIQRVQLTRQRRHDITSQEMKALMDQRDRSLAQCRRLQQEVMMQDRKHLETKKQLVKGQSERDAALEAEPVLQTNPSDVQLVQTPPSDGPQQAPPLLAQLQQLAKDKQSLEAELVRCQEAEREASERVCRLERLVEVLRKKVGTGSLRAVV
ncbi:mirror-image polydactyly gene 1 protein isoform X2 [Nerophis lumbriciformis]|uniref:mirror-image polydactyly gene 1 protein isoform X2 n=1 Tax=Nerophis lumbriciformis TaxID=546530 RepID=UPI002ADFD94E|nr:mirror-image polydactyly gene 1 protein-like isoform X2 [Nerophis lumbriciformis]